MKITRFVPAPDGGSQFVDLEFAIDLAQSGGWGHRSQVIPAQSTVLGELPAGVEQDWHPASRRQILAILSGTVEIEVSDGQKRRLGPGDMFLADDCGSRGHKTRTIGGPARILFVHLPADLALD
ncbi:MAG: cupin domain-containing protein [Stellaceae bacterium]